MQLQSHIEMFRFEPLSWDSAHFGIAVARLHGPCGERPADRGVIDELRHAVESARAAGIVLLYWAAQPRYQLPESILPEIGGVLVDRKATFEIELDGRAEPERNERLVLNEYPTEMPSSRLIALAVSAGAYSRFHRDPRIPAAAFRALYEQWITRSALREIADAVLVATWREATKEPIGLITLSVAEAAGSIGLIAVLAHSRGAGVGALLLRGGHRWLAARGATQVSVVTQLDNRPACRLYEKEGYRLADVKLVYHFWPQEIALGRRALRTARPSVTEQAP
jgi:dTDP-4-amino-4,6-dideoxy-D-galactose acyltransferase